MFFFQLPPLCLNVREEKWLRVRSRSQLAHAIQYISENGRELRLKSPVVVEDLSKNAGMAVEEVLVEYGIVVGQGLRQPREPRRRDLLEGGLVGLVAHAAHVERDPVLAVHGEAPSAAATAAAASATAAETAEGGAAVEAGGRRRQRGEGAEEGGRVIAAVGAAGNAAARSEGNRGGGR